MTRAAGERLATIAGGLRLANADTAGVVDLVRRDDSVLELLSPDAIITALIATRILEQFVAQVFAVTLVGWVSCTLRPPAVHRHRRLTLVTGALVFLV